jgi:hypothetical protein
MAMLLHTLTKSLMMRYSYPGMLLLVLAVTLSSCELIGDIFQAGMAVGIIVVVAIVALIIWIISRFRR